MNTHPLHFDENTEATEFGKTLVNSTFTVAVMVGMSVSDISQKAIANLGWTDIALPHPLLWAILCNAESEVLEKVVRIKRKLRHRYCSCGTNETVWLWLPPSAQH